MTGQRKHAAEDQAFGESQDPIIQDPGFAEPQDPIILDEAFELLGPNEAGMLTGRFYAFNTVVNLQSFDTPEHCPKVFEQARIRCRRYERLFSRTLPHSDISRINAAQGQEVEIHEDSFRLLEAAQLYCSKSGGLFDISIGSLTRLWDFNREIIPPKELLSKALQHVNWKSLEIRKAEGRFFARLNDPEAAIDVGGIAKGYIADELGCFLESNEIHSFIVNLGGNVLARGCKPKGAAWRIGLQDPRDSEKLVGAVELSNASAVTSGIYERSFTKEDTFYHHILNPKTGFPVETDVAGVTVIAKRSLDAEGFSTTLLALGIDRGLEFAKNEPAIQQAYFVNRENKVIALYK